MHVHVALSSHNLNIHRLYGLTGRERREEKVKKEKEERTVENKSYFQSPSHIEMTTMLQGRTTL